ncbi:MAG: hypothetical protein ABSH44_21865 [Bryobacteraceae bacterium]|jgi:hypothetical protein
MIPAALLAMLLTTRASAQQPTQAEILERVAEEAEVLEQNAPKALTQETLEQRALIRPPRFRPRAGKAATETPKPRLVVREIISEYSVGTLKETDSRDLVEFRQVISVDGRRVQSAEHARHALSLGIQSADDRIRKRMLEDFARHGLVDVATDYGLILLAFTKRGLENMQLKPAGESRVGAEDALALRWRQTSTAGGELEFFGNVAVRRALQGMLYVRKSDGLPLRVQAWAEHPDAARVIRDEATVDYRLSAHGFLMPASVVHRHLVDGQLKTENLYRYEPFKLFSADAEIKFTEVPEPPPAPPAPPKK